VLVAAGATAVAVAALSACSSATGGTTVSAPSAVAPASSAAVSTAAAAPAVAEPAPDTSSPVVAPKPKPKPKPKNYCASNTAAQKVIVSIRKQHAWMCARHIDVFDTGVTTGMVGQWTETPTGNYQIQGRNMNTVLTLNTGAQYDVKYWIPFSPPLFGFHDSSWQQFRYGSPKYKTDGSHGCIHMPLRAMKFLYNWSAEPTDVHIA
jgi:hypothetical protein